MTEGNGVERSLGRIEGGVEEALNQIKLLRDELGNHRNDDQMNFSNVRREFKEQTETINKRFEENELSRGAQLKGIDDRAHFARGAGWVILGMLSVMATIIGGCVIAVFNGWLRVPHP